VVSVNNAIFGLLVASMIGLFLFELGCDRATARFLGHSYRSRSTVYAGAASFILAALWLVYNLI